MSSDPAIYLSNDVKNAADIEGMSADRFRQAMACQMITDCELDGNMRECVRKRVIQEAEHIREYYRRREDIEEQ
jgi:hypothetical protein